jgi:thiol-disulfide isomerase/thioredoxin
METSNYTVFDDATYAAALASPLPLFLLLWTSWCQHCPAFKPVWYEFANRTRKLNAIRFGEINCADCPSPCHAITGAGYPRAVWLEARNSRSVLYDGAWTANDLSQFAKRQMNFPFAPIAGEAEVKTMLADESAAVVFYVAVESDDAEQQSALRAIAKRYRSSTARFASADGPFSVRAYKSESYFVEYGGGVSVEAICEFIDRNSEPLLPTLTEALQNKMAAAKEARMVFFTDGSKAPPIGALAGGGRWKFALDAKKDSWLRKYAQMSTVPSVMILDPGRKRWAWYRGPWIREEINSWADSFDVDNAKWDGPGVGLLSPLR